MMAPIRTVVIQAVVAVEVHDGRREHGERVITLSDLVGGQQVAQRSFAIREKGIIHPLAARLTLGTLSLADGVHVS